MTSDRRTASVGFRSVLWSRGRAQVITEQAIACRTAHAWTLLPLSAEARDLPLQQMCWHHRKPASPGWRSTHRPPPFLPWSSFHSRFSALTWNCGRFLKRFPVQSCDHQRLGVSRLLRFVVKADQRGSHVHRSGCTRVVVVEMFYRSSSLGWWHKFISRTDLKIK